MPATQRGCCLQLRMFGVCGRETRGREIRIRRYPCVRVPTRHLWFSLSCHAPTALVYLNIEKPRRAGSRSFEAGWVPSFNISPPVPRCLLVLLPRLLPPSLSPRARPVPPLVPCRFVLRCGLVGLFSLSDVALSRHFFGFHLFTCSMVSFVAAFCCLRRARGLVGADMGSFMVRLVCSISTL